MTQKDEQWSYGGSVENRQTARFLAPESGVTFDPVAQEQGNGA